MKTVLSAIIGVLIGMFIMYQIATYSMEFTIFPDNSIDITILGQTNHYR